MSKLILTIATFFAALFCYSQDDHGNYFSKPFSIFNSSGKEIVAGSVNTFVYSNYFGKDVAKQSSGNAHKKPEYLVYQFFTAMKLRDFNAISKLFDSSFDRKDFESNSITQVADNSSDIRYCSKFITGDRTIVRYDFISKKGSFPYFAIIKRIQGEYYLTSSLDLSDPFNVVGSLSPFNMFDKSTSQASVAGMTPFYFIEKEGKIFYTTQKPDEDFTAVYLKLEKYYPNSKASEIEVLKQLQRVAREKDFSRVKDLLIKNDWPLLTDSKYNSYLNDKILNIFRNNSNISPLCSIQTGSGKILYFEYSNPGQGSNIASIALNKSINKYYLSMKFTNSDENNVLQNIYVREAIYDYLKQKS